MAGMEIDSLHNSTASSAIRLVEISRRANPRKQIKELNFDQANAKQENAKHSKELVAQELIGMAIRFSCSNVKL